MTNRPSETDIKLRIAKIITDSEELMFERFDNLHKFQITDTDVVDYLRTEGMEAVARRYADWQDLPIVFDEDNTTMNPVVPDPGDVTQVAPGYTRFHPEAGGILDIPDHLVDSFLRGGAEAPTLTNDEPSHEGWNPEHFRVAGCDGSLHPEDCLGNAPDQRSAP
jgi:hypothetical protein